MKKQIITGIAIAACFAFCAAVWPQSAEVGNLPTKPVKTVSIGEIEDRSEETLQILLSAGAPTPKPKSILENKPSETEIIAEKEIPEPAST